ncbi:class I SAM-dependent methyltransferase [Streptomyces celluloflavus]|uniref:class I SAM-dependent methyltransferase n=1 Tax=Streptomyces celluloflavus TaxID=58344 RepID=UPI003665E260
MAGDTPNGDTRTFDRARLLEMMTAFKATYLIRAAVELRLFDALADGPADPDTVAAILGTSPRGTRILLRALAAADLLDMDGEEFALLPGVRELLVASSPSYAGGVVRVAASDLEWDTMRDLAQTVRRGGTLLDTGAQSPDFPYWVDFAEYQTLATRPGAAFVSDLLRPWAAGRAQLDVLDIGCGHGMFGFAVAELAESGLVCGVDGAAVLEVAARNAERSGLGGRCRFVAGDAFEVPLGGPYDVAVLGNVLFQFPFERAVELLRRVREALRPQGRVVLAGFTTGDTPPRDSYHAHMLELLMLAWTGAGELHSTGMYRKMLASSGFIDSEVHSQPGLPLRVVLARRP